MEGLLLRTRKENAGTFGSLSFDKAPLHVLTLERPDYNHDGIIGNEKGNSCIPEGRYRCFRRSSEIVQRCYSHFEHLPAAENSTPLVEEIKKQLMDGQTFEIEGVTCGESEGTRTAVLIHPGNVIGDLRGCIAVGTGLGIVNGQKGIINSREAFFEFMMAMYGIDEFYLTIRYEKAL